MRNRFKKIISTVLALVLSGTMLISAPISVRADSSIVEKAITWAMKIANDNSHGYSQLNRWGPDYDCSSFIIQAFKNAGADIDTSKVSYTGNMRSYFTTHGFIWIPWSQIGDKSKLIRGDILLCEGVHTELYIGNGQLVGAHTDYGYPQTGDQTGKEISVTSYYYSSSQPWGGVLRYSGNVASNSCDCSISYAGTYVVNTDNSSLIMRSGHGTGYSIITTIPEGTDVKVSKGNGSWAHVEWNGYSGYCSMEYLKKKYNNPKGTIDSISGGVGSVDVRGWAFDLDDISTSIYIDVYIGGPAGSGVPCHTITADKYRPDVNKVYSVGDNHGYSEKIYTDYTGMQDVYVYAINVGGGSNVLIGSKRINIDKAPETVTGWSKEENTWYYYDNEGNKVTGWQQIDNKSYYFNESGAIQSSKWIKNSGKWYHLNSSGAMETSKWISGTYYVKADGTMAASEVVEDEYYVGADGKWQKYTGWQKINNTWYYFDSKSVIQKSKWIKTNSKWYYVGEKGIMQMSKWLKNNNKWYYVNNDGVMQTGWQKINNKQYYFGNDGVMQTSKWISGTYYVKADGTMAVSEWVDNGKYYVDADGKWVKGAKIEKILMNNK